MIIFLLFIFFSVFIPGYLFAGKTTKYKGTSIFLSFSIGLAVFALISIFAGYLGLSSFVIVYIVLAIAIFVYKKRYKKIFDISIKLRSVWEYVLLIIVGTIFQLLITFRSGLEIKGGVGYWGPLGHDGIWHHALAGQLANQVPPKNPIFSGEILVGYHYLYDVLIAQTHRMTMIPIPDLIYRYYPILFSILLGFGSLCLLRTLFKRKEVILISLFTIYFGSSFGWILTYLRDRVFWGESIFWMNQAVSFNINPPFAISLVLLIAVILLFNQFKSTKDKKIMFFIGIIVASLFEFKVYAGLLILVCLFLVAIQQLLFKKKKDYLFLFLLSLMFSSVFLIPQIRLANELIIFKPFWFINSMIDSTDRVGWIRFSLAKQSYFERGLIIRFVLLQIIALGIFILGNMGTRVVALLALVRVKKSDIFRLSKHTILVLLAIVSIVIPLGFVQRGNMWNTIQFGYYFLYIASIYSGLGLYILLSRFPGVLKTVIIIIIIILTPISSYGTAKTGVEKTPSYLVANYELEALKFLDKQSNGVVFTHPSCIVENIYCGKECPDNCFSKTSYVSAYSGMQSFLDDSIQQEILLTEYDKREREIIKLYHFDGRINTDEFLKRNNIGYLYIYKEFIIKAPDSTKTENIFENEKIIIYKVN